MNPSRLFIMRPVATALTMVAILLAGAIAYRQLPVSALPQIDYPTIQVLTFYPGASPDVMASSVTAPLERQFGQMPGLNQMTSTSSGGSSVVTLQFSLDLSLDIAEQQVQAAINAASTFLPRDIPSPPIYSKVNPADAPILTLALTSPTLPLSQIEDLAETRFAQKISQLSGVGLVSLGGGQRPAVRIRANPRALSAYGLTLEDLRAAVAAANVNQAKGGFDGPRRSSIINATDQLLSSRDYEPLIIAYRNGGPVHISDVAEVADDVENVRQAAWMNETQAVLVNIQRQPGANVIEVADRIKKLLPQLQSTLPSSVQVTVLTDRTTSIRASVRDVQFELMLAVGLVVMVIFLFLRTLSATVIPAAAVPLSLIGTFAAMYLMGFSLNNLTLMALTISTGFVVDDAIVMIENISRYIERGDSPLQAALKGSQQIAFTILSLSISLIAVLIPLLFMGDVVGRLFREFAVTLSMTIVISAIVSLTLTPMMCARLLRYRRDTEQNAFYRWSQTVFDRTIAAYGRTLRWVLNHQPATLTVAVVTLVVTIVMYVAIPKGFFPVQDTGVLLGISEAPQSISFAAMVERQQALAAAILADPAVASLSSFIGVDGINTTLNSGRVQINLKPFDKRRESAQDVILRLQQAATAVDGITLYLQPMQDLTVEDRVSRTQYQYTLEDADPKELSRWAPALGRGITEASGVARCQQRSAGPGPGFAAGDRPEHGLPSWHYAATDRRYSLRCLRATAGVHDVHPVEPVPGRARGHAGISERPPSAPVPGHPFVDRRPGAVERVYPIFRDHHAVGHQPPRAVPCGRRCHSIWLRAIRSVTPSTRSSRPRNASACPPSVHGSFQGTAQAFQASLGNETWLILAALVTVYIVLGILYESYIHPLTILSTLPSAGVGALVALMLFNTEFSVIALIGIILLIGIVKKNAIMMIDFALDAERKDGKPPTEAIYEACLLRFRPIMMTTMAALLGALPLAIGSGVGSELRHPLGIAIIGGLDPQSGADALYDARRLSGV